eukprot:TRINITY_DN4567_c0_g1_i1.p1 TRINITY_DN4567_c0_g1~~TRINITY_DN4567_c0_g1_i1.p1  ORF type:complete len:493 (+),score=74.64 TRINITY_DN4567_c0_g1_i1:72-1550(+)
MSAGDAWDAGSEDERSDYGDGPVEDPGEENISPENSDTGHADDVACLADVAGAQKAEDEEDDEHKGLSPLDLVFAVVLDEQMRSDNDTTTEQDDPWRAIGALQVAKGSNSVVAAAVVSANAGGPLSPVHDDDDDNCLFYSSGEDEEEPEEDRKDNHGLFGLYQLASETHSEEWHARRKERIEQRAREDWEDIQAISRVALHHHSPFVAADMDQRSQLTLHASSETHTVPATPRTPPPAVQNPRRPRSPPAFRLNQSRRPPGNTAGPRAPGSERRASALLDSVDAAVAAAEAYEKKKAAERRKQAERMPECGSVTMIEIDSDGCAGVSLAVPQPFQRTLPAHSVGLVRAHRAAQNAEAPDWRDILRMSNADAAVARARRDREVAAQLQANKERERVFKEVMASLYPTLPTPVQSEAPLLPPQSARRSSSAHPAQPHSQLPRRGNNGGSAPLCRGDTLRRSDGMSATQNGEKVKLRPIFGPAASAPEAQPADEE